MSTLQKQIPKARTGITGLDEITQGGLPAGRPTLICGSAGCGKTVFAMEFLVRGATQFDEPGVFVSFEEKEEDLVANVKSLGFDLPKLIRQKKIAIDHVRVERSEIEETGEYDLEGLFVRLGYALDRVKGKRIVLDTIEALFSGLDNQGILRAELRRLFFWLKDRGVTAIITGERGDGLLTRHGLEEYVSDCVILLDHRVEQQQSTRRLRIVKYRGASHGTNEFPFLINSDGISVMPISSSTLDHDVSGERITSGLPDLDDMLGGRGFYRGSSVLISGTPGMGKSTLSALFARATCEAGGKCLYFSFEESPAQVVRNMRSVGINLEPYLRKGLLTIHSSRPSLYGLEMHLAVMHKLVVDSRPSAVILDPINNLLTIGSAGDVRSMLMRLFDFLKRENITGLFTNLTTGDRGLEASDVGLSSLMDTWILLRDIEINGERNRGVYILKSRGMSHSNQIREFIMSDRGVQLVDAYLGVEGVLTGAARAAQEIREKAESEARVADTARKRQALERKRKALAARIEALKAEFGADELELKREIEMDELRERGRVEDRSVMSRYRKLERASKKNGSRTYERKNGQSA